MTDLFSTLYILLITHNIAWVFVISPLAFLVCAIVIDFLWLKVTWKIYRAWIRFLDRIMPKNFNFRLGVSLTVIAIIAIQFLFAIIHAFWK